MGLLDGTSQDQYYQGNDHGNYQFVSLDDIITQFQIMYIGEDKLIPRAKRADIAFHAQRALAELSFDTFKSYKSQQIDLPPSLTMVLPHDYVNYTKISWADSAGIKRPLYPTKHTSNPFQVKQDALGEYALTAVATLVDGTSAISLDGEYSTISVGMTVSGHGINHTGEPNIPDGTIVIGSSNANGITTIEVGVADPDHFTGYTAVKILLLTSPVTQTLTFGYADGALMEANITGVILENVAWSKGDLSLIHI